MPDRVNTVETSDDFNQGRVTWNNNDAILESRIDDLVIENAQYFERLLVTNKISDSFGDKFMISLNTGETIRNGSILVIVNGVYYLSHTNQTTITAPTDFHIGDDFIVIHNTSNGGSINLVESDLIGVYFQKEQTS